MALYIDKNGLKIEVKRKYAYRYNKAGSVVGRTELDGAEGLMHFIDLMRKAGFERDAEDYRKSCKRVEKNVVAPLNPYADEEPIMGEEK
jgi:hypothetical protein